MVFIEPLAQHQASQPNNSVKQQHHWPRAKSSRTSRGEVHCAFRLKSSQQVVGELETPTLPETITEVESGC